MFIKISALCVGCRGTAAIVSIVRGPLNSIAVMDVGHLVLACNWARPGALNYRNRHPEIWESGA